jgi:hypothetical protein
MTTRRGGSSAFFLPAQAYVASWLASFKDFLPRQKAASFSLEQVMEQLQTAGTASAN